MDSTRWGERRFQSLAADAVSRLPDYDHRLPYRVIVDAPPSGDGWLFSIAIRLPKQPDTVLAVMSINRDELI